MNKILIILKKYLNSLINFNSLFLVFSVITTYFIFGDSINNKTINECGGSSSKVSPENNETEKDVEIEKMQNKILSLEDEVSKLKEKSVKHEEDLQKLVDFIKYKPISNDNVIQSQSRESEENIEKRNEYFLEKSSPDNSPTSGQIKNSELLIEAEKIHTPVLREERIYEDNKKINEFILGSVTSVLFKK